MKGGATAFAGPAAQAVSVVTGMRFSAPPEQVWVGLMFYEQITQRPPLHLRLLLPVPERAEGRQSAVGDVTRCVYREGYLLKRITEILPCRLCRFEVLKQELPIAGEVRLTSGSYALRELPDRSTRVELETRYLSPRYPRWLWGPIEIAVCHSFHRHILGAMRRAVESPAAASSKDALRECRTPPALTGERGPS
ncbi:MAG TPA: hypothetical protein VMR54_17045 [Thermoanaerobaculia bacterium]|nr:hypothetical protein [Thermoanaerobaculia bacterium]